MATVREHWGSRFGFLLASIGSAVGLGNIWRFNYLAYKWGGGTFILVYIFAILTAALPILILEYGVGHRFRRVAPLAFRRIGKPLEVIGWIPAVQMGFIAVYYCVILAWVLNYLYFAPTLAWGEDTNGFFFDHFLQASGSPWSLQVIVPAILLTLFIVWFLNWVVIIRGLRQGMELYSKILMPILVLLAIILIVRGVTLPGSLDGIRAYLTPVWGKLGQPRLWVDAFSQVFFSISAGFGIMIAFASFLPKRTNLVSAGLTVALANSGFFEIILGLGSFGTLGYLAMKTGKPMEEVVTSGIGFAFVVFPEALSKLPWVPSLFAVFFFLTLFIAGFTSSLSLVEAVTATFRDKFRWARKRVVTGLCLFAFVLGLLFVTRGGLYILDIVDHFITPYVLLFIGTAECVIVGWIYGVDKLIAHHNRQPGMSLQALFGTVITYVVPVILLTISWALAVTNLGQAEEALTLATESGGSARFWAYASELWVPAIITVLALALFGWSLRARNNRQYAYLIKFWLPAVLTLVFYQGWFDEFKHAYGDYPAGALALFGGGFLLHIIVLGFLFAHSRGHPEVEAELDAPEPWEGDVAALAEEAGA